VERDASIERNASSRTMIAVDVSADLISALRIASNSLAAVFQVFAHSRSENAVDPGYERLQSSGALAEREEGSFGTIWSSKLLEQSHIVQKQKRSLAKFPMGPREAPKADAKHRLPACIVQRLSDGFEPFPRRSQFHRAMRSGLSVQAGSLCYFNPVPPSALRSAAV
jgi:hypothetical protein